MKMKTGAIVAGVFLFACFAGLGLAGRSAEDEGKSEDKPVPPGMVLVPAGDFVMGMSAEDGLAECRKFFGDEVEKSWLEDEEPAHKVYLDSFFIDKLEVTQEDYQKCVSAGKCEKPRSYEGLAEGLEGKDLPAVGVSWEDARSYCAYVGKRLPHEAEWEKAARGEDGRMYPWGNEFDGKRANFCDKNCPRDRGGKDYDDGRAKLAPAGSYPGGASPYGALDMAGNVWEWTADWHDKDYYKTSPDKSPMGPEFKEGRDTATRVIRGGSWTYTMLSLRATERDRLDPRSKKQDLGFRCAMDY